MTTSHTLKNIITLLEKLMTDIGLVCTHFQNAYPMYFDGLHMDYWDYNVLKTTHSNSRYVLESRGKNRNFTKTFNDGNSGADLSTQNAFRQHIKMSSILFMFLFPFMLSFFY